MSDERGSNLLKLILIIFMLIPKFYENSSYLKRPCYGINSDGPVSTDCLDTKRAVAMDL